MIAKELTQYINKQLSVSLLTFVLRDSDSITLLFWTCINEERDRDREREGRWVCRCYASMLVLLCALSSAGSALIGELLL